MERRDSLVSSRVAARLVCASVLALGFAILPPPIPATAECESPELLLTGPEIGETTYGYCGAVDSDRTAWLQTLNGTLLVRKRWGQPFDETQDFFGVPPKGPDPSLNNFAAI